MAHLGSPTSHGGTIITGSGGVGDGFVMGDAGGATIINFKPLVGLGTSSRTTNFLWSSIGTTVENRTASGLNRSGRTLMSTSGQMVLSIAALMADLLKRVGHYQNRKLREPALCAT
jgi:hypothetical protein